MKQEIAERWVQALRSGKYKQGRRVLKQGENFCCLGVLCEVTGTPYRPGSVCSAMPSRAARQRLGLDDELADNLASLNDQGTSFKQLANIIEQEA